MSKITFGEAISSDDFSDGLFKEEPKEQEKKEDKVLLELNDNDNLFNLGEDKEDGEKEEEESEEGDKPFLDIEETPTSPYKNYVKTLVESGEWVFDGIEDENGEIIPFEDLEIDEELFNEIKKQQKEEIKGKVKEEIFSSLDDTEKEFLEFKKNGGDLQKYFQTLNTKKQITELDISTDGGKLLAMRTYYQNVLGKSAEWTEKYINRSIKAMEIDAEAEEAKSELDRIAAKQHEDVVKAQEKAALEAEKARVKATEDLKEKLKEDKLAVKEVNSIVKGFTEMDERGLTEIDKHYLTLRNDPTKAKLVWDMLTNPEEFIKKMAKKEVAEKDLKTFKTIKLARKKVNSKSSVTDNDDFIINLN